MSEWISFLSFHMSGLLALQLCGTLGMFGIVCFVHVVQYPMLARVPTEARKAFETEYCNRASIVIAPLMLLEAISASALCFAGPHAYTSLAWLGCALVGGLWAVTFFVSVPAHDALIREWDDRVHRRLLLSNFLRVLLWAGRVVVVLLMGPL